MFDELKQDMPAIIKNVIDRQPAVVAAHVRKRFFPSAGDRSAMDRLLDLRRVFNCPKKKGQRDGKWKTHLFSTMKPAKKPGTDIVWPSS